LSPCFMMLSPESLDWQGVSHEDQAAIFRALADETDETPSHPTQQERAVSSVDRAPHIEEDVLAAMSAEDRAAVLEALADEQGHGAYPVPPPSPSPPSPLAPRATPAALDTPPRPRSPWERATSSTSQLPDQASPDVLASLSEADRVAVLQVLADDNDQNGSELLSAPVAHPAAPRLPFRPSLAESPHGFGEDDVWQALVDDVPHPLTRRYPDGASFGDNPLSEEELSKIRSAVDFRYASMHKQHPLRHELVPDFDDQQQCHRIPNSLLYEAFRRTDDPEIKNELVRFAFSTDNIASQHKDRNKEHSRWEREAGLYPKGVSDRMSSGLAARMNTALYRDVEEGRMQPKTRGHLLDVISDKSNAGREFVAKRDMRCYLDDHSRLAIQEARGSIQRQRWEDRREANASRPRPSSAAPVGRHVSLGSADGSDLYEGTRGGIFHMSATGRPVYHRASSPPRPSRPSPPFPPSPPSPPPLVPLSPCRTGFGSGHAYFPDNHSTAGMGSMFRSSSSGSIGFHSSSGSANGRPLYQGSRGGVFHYSASGRRVYH